MTGIAHRELEDSWVDLGALCRVSLGMYAWVTQVAAWFGYAAAGGSLRGRHYSTSTSVP